MELDHQNLYHSTDILQSRQKQGTLLHGVAIKPIASSHENSKERKKMKESLRGSSPYEQFFMNELAHISL